MKPHQLDHHKDRFAAMRAAADKQPKPNRGRFRTDPRGQSKIDTGTGYVLLQDTAQDGARIVAERERAERDRDEANARQLGLF